MSNLQTVTSETFQSEVLNSEIPVVVDFFASWCPPCRALGPILDRLSTEFAGQVRIVKVDSDEDPQLAGQFNVTGLPTIIFFQDGKQVGQISGLPQEFALREKLKTWVQQPEANR